MCQVSCLTNQGWPNLGKWHKSLKNATWDLISKNSTPLSDDIQNAY